MAMHNPQLPRGKRRGRGDCEEFADLGYHNGKSIDFHSNGKDVPVIIAEAKRRCLEPTPFAEWNSVPDIVSNGYHHHHHLMHQEQPCLSHTMQTGLPDAHMELSREQLHGAITSNGHSNGFEHDHHNNNFHHQRGGQQIDLNGGGEPATPVISNGYYGYIAHYDHAGSDVEEDSMDTGLTVQAEYAIDAPSSCIEPKERRVCVRCSAGEPI